MGMIGGGYGPQNWSDRLAIIGAALKDASPGSSGDNLVRQQQMMLGRQQFQLQRQAMGQMMGLFGGQAQYQDGPDPSVSAPHGVAAAAGATPANSAGLDDMTGALAQATGQPQTVSGATPAAAPAQPYVYRPPVQTSTGAASLSDPATQRTLAMASMLGVPGAKEITDLLDKSRPTVKIGPDGTPYDERGAASLMQHFANRTNVNGQVVDLNDPGNTNRVIPTAPVPGANPVFDNRGNVVDWQLPGGAARAIGAAAAAKTGAEEAAKLPYVGPTSFAQARGSTRGNLQVIPNAAGGSTVMGGDEYLDGRPGPASGAPGGSGPIPQVGGPTAAGGPARAGLGTSQSPADAEYQKNLASSAAAHFAALQTAGAAAPGAIARLQQMRTLLKGWEGGKYSPEAVDLASAVNSLPALGIKMDPKYQNAQAAQALQAQMTMELMKNPDTGANMFPRVTNFEMQQFTKAVPGLMQSAGSRDTLINMYSAVQQRAADIAQNAYQWNQKYGRIDAPDATGQSFQQRLNGWSTKHPLFAGVPGAAEALKSGQQ